MPAIQSINQGEHMLQVISASFRDILNQEQLNTALTVWKEQFADAQSFTPFRFIRAVEKRLDIRLSSDNRRQLISTLPEKMSDPNPQPNQVDKSPPMPEAVPPSPTRAGNTEPSHVIFEFVLGHLLRQLSPGKNHILAQLSRSTLNASARHMIQRYYTINQPVAVPPLSLEVMTQVTDLAYGWACDILGPGQTDRLFNNIFRQAEMLPEALSFPPRKLL